MARALSDRTIDGTAVTAGAQAGFDIDLGSLIDGNSVRVTYTDNAVGHSSAPLTLMRVDDPDALPLSDSATADPNDQVIGLDFSGGMASVVSQLTAALGTDRAAVLQSGRQYAARPRRRRRQQGQRRCGFGDLYGHQR